MLLLLDRLFAYLASEAGVTTGPPSSSNNGAESRSAPSEQETHIHLQDYNRSVLELVMFPNPSDMVSVHPDYHTSPRSVFAKMKKINS